jgi:hypothetical protein
MVVNNINSFQKGGIITGQKGEIARPVIENDYFINKEVEKMIVESNKIDRSLYVSVDKVIERLKNIKPND